MTASHLFEDFGDAKAQERFSSRMPVEDIEDQKLESFENGYQAGWDDAVAAQTETLSFVSSGLANSLQNASFEYHELRATLNASVETIIGQVVDVVLPQIANASLGAHVREKMAALTRKNLDRDIEIVVAPESEAAVRTALDDDPPKPFVLITDELLAPTQVVLRLDRNEAELHLDRAVAEISAAVTSFFENQANEVKDG
ncbi:hypothetical protein [uncultured Tateyamaria sp.]|uniref:hypothetical protein n=1 Tax=uncultured Tateyamaria sp. TaxID=455651 RepID=UPI00261490E6|nr:hypothetical protein [uncultured Tateyamaria sp.]